MNTELVFSVTKIFFIFIIICIYMIMKPVWILISESGESYSAQSILGFLNHGLRGQLQKW